MAARVQETIGGSVEVTFVDQGDTGDAPAAGAQGQDVRLAVMKLPTAKRALCFYLVAG